MSKNKLTGGVITAVVAVLVLSLWGWQSLPDGRLHLWFLDVGQGDAILMRLPAGELILVDGGPDDLLLEKMGSLLPYYERDLELVILTHPHADHINGLVEVLGRYRVKNLLLTGVQYDYIGYDRLLELAAANGVKFWYPGGGRDLRIGRVGLDLIYPAEPLNGRGFKNINNSSLVFRLIEGDFAAMFSGDAEKEVEKELLERPGLRLEAELLKAGHHGSKTSNSVEWLRRVGPGRVVISCGADNSFGHPFAGTLENFRKIGAEIFRTDLEGTIALDIP